MQANGSIGNLSWLNLTIGQGSPSLIPFPLSQLSAFHPHLTYSLFPSPGLEPFPLNSVNLWWLMTGWASNSRLVVSKGLEGFSGQMEATFIRSHLGRWLLIEGLTVTRHFEIMSFAQMSFHTNVASRKCRFAQMSHHANVALCKCRFAQMSLNQDI
jgi:hypothetical protein